jgi:uncharacterized membrane protein
MNPGDLSKYADSQAELEKLVKAQPEVQKNMEHIKRLVEEIKEQTDENLTEREDLKQMMDSFGQKKSHYDQANN